VRVSVDPELCQGHGLCRMSAPGVFLLDDEDGHAYVRDEELAPDQEALARLGAESCPERAISLRRNPPGA
jgi:ferredoxin